MAFQSLPEDGRLAFGHVANDRQEALSRVLSGHPVREWMTWMNESGETLLDLATRRRCQRSRGLLLKLRDDGGDTFRESMGAVAAGGFSAPDAVVEREVAIPPVIVEDWRVIEVPEKHHHRIHHVVQTVQEKVVPVSHEVPVVETHVKNEFVVSSRTEPTVTEVPQVTVHEERVPVFISREDILPDLEVVEGVVRVPARRDREIRAPAVDVRPRVKHMAGDTTYTHDEHVDEVPIVVEVPHTTLAPKREVVQTKQHVAVEQLVRSDRIQVVPVTKKTCETVEIPQRHTFRRVHHVPMIEYVSSDATEAPRGAEDHVQASGDLQALQTYAESLTQQTGQLELLLAGRRRELNGLNEELRNAKHATEAAFMKLSKERDSICCSFRSGRTTTVPVEVIHTTCFCGNVCEPDSMFCRRCGVRRPTPAKNGVVRSRSADTTCLRTRVVTPRSLITAVSPGTCVNMSPAATYGAPLSARCAGRASSTAAHPYRFLYAPRAPSAFAN